MIFMKYCFGSLMLLYGCGLPDYSAIDPPTLESRVSSSIVAFRTPSNDQYVQGYILYYKIYTGDTDYNAVGESDSEKFNDETQHSSGEIPIGESVPKQQGYFKMGSAEENNFDDFTIPHANIGANTTVYIDFDSDKEQAIVYTDSDNKTVIKELARGVLDHRQGDGKFLKFFNDWDFDATDPQNGYTDGDLYRGTGDVLQYQPVGSEGDLTNIKTIAEPLTAIDNPLTSGDNSIIIGIAVHAIGRDLSTLQLLYSTPVHLGTVTTVIEDTDRP